MIVSKTELKIAELQRVLELQLPFRDRWGSVSVKIEGQDFVIRYSGNEQKQRTKWEFHDIAKPLTCLNSSLYYEKKSLYDKFKNRRSDKTYLENIKNG